MELYIGLDVSLASTAICVVDAHGNAERERAEAQRLEDRKADAEHRERLEREMSEVRQLLFAVSQYPPPPQ